MQRRNAPMHRKKAATDAADYAFANPPYEANRLRSRCLVPFQNAMNGPAGAPVTLAPWMATNTLRPKKNGNPQSKALEDDKGEPRLLKAVEPLCNRESALATLKSMLAFVPFAPWMVAERLRLDGGQ